MVDLNYSEKKYVKKSNNFSHLVLQTLINCKY